MKFLKLYESFNIEEDVQKVREILSYLSDDGFNIDVYSFEGIKLSSSFIGIDIDKGPVEFDWEDIKSHLMELISQMDKWDYNGSELYDIHGNDVGFTKRLGLVTITFIPKPD